MEQAIREEIPPSELNTILDNIGMPYSGINLTYSNSGVLGTSDAEITRFDGHSLIRVDWYD